jgi:membrane protease YdiL (CAAX protease family)
MPRRDCKLPAAVVERQRLPAGLLVRDRLVAIAVTALLFTAWHIPPRLALAAGVEGRAGDLPSVLIGTGAPVLVVALVLGVAWDRWRNLPALVAVHWGIDLLPIVGSLLQIPPK